MLHRFVLILALCTITLAFPDSGSLVVGEPPLIKPANGPSCSVQLLQAACDNYNLVNVANFTLRLSSCPSDKWSKLVLNLNGAVNGTQYDRFGAVWIGGVEVLRTTTPEPTTAGITWFVEKDISYLKQYLLDSAVADGLQIFLTIPNNVDSTYTGIFAVNLTLDIYLASDSDSVVITNAPTVIPLTNAPYTASSAPWNALQVIGDQALTYTSTLPTTSPSSISQLTLEVYASPHGCEEFYYSNIPSTNASQLGLCGGGNYRELQVYIDGIFAGATYAFPVMYSGGVNPLLWRPVAGIASFNIPPHRFDLSPFLGTLLTNNSSTDPHTISVTVLGNNQESGGYWYLDAALYLGVDPVLAGLGAVVASSSPVVVTDFDATIIEANHLGKVSDGPVYEFNTTGSHAYSISGQLLLTDGSTVTKTVKGSLQMKNTNRLVGTSTAYTTQYTLAQTTVATSRMKGDQEVVLGSETVEDFFPYYLYSYYAQNATTMDLEASILFAYHRMRSSNYDQSIAWRNSIAASASYNRSTDHAAYNVEEGQSKEHFLLGNPLATSTTCYARELAAADGFVSQDVSQGSTADCVYAKKEDYYCGLDVCSTIIAALPGRREEKKQQPQLRSSKYDNQKIYHPQLQSLINGLMIAANTSSSSNTVQRKVLLTKPMPRTMTVAAIGAEVASRVSKNHVIDRLSNGLVLRTPRTIYQRMMIQQ